jgi:hypothetical protein
MCFVLLSMKRGMSLNDGTNNDFFSKSMLLFGKFNSLKKIFMLPVKPSQCRSYGLPSENYVYYVLHIVT